MMNSSSDATGTDLAKLPEPTPEERAVLSAHIARMKQKRPSPRVKLVEKAGSVELSTDHPIPPLGNALIMESLGTADFDFYDGLRAFFRRWAIHGLERIGAKPGTHMERPASSVVVSHTP
jgi:hypothetical protein